MPMIARTLRCLLMVCPLVPGLSGCGGGTELDTGKAPSEVMLFAAASTTNALDEIKARVRESRDEQVRTNYAGSSTLAQQITHGAAADLFLSADPKWAGYLEEKGLVSRRRDLLGNRLVVVVPADSGLPVAKIEDLAGEQIERLALADPAAVPAGVYAKEALTKLGLWDRLRKKVVAGDDVRRALFFVETGNAQAGIVYATDAAISRKVRVAVEIDPGLTRPIRYPLVLLTHGAKNPAAVQWFEDLGSPQSAEIFRKYGFTVLEPAAGGPK
jgi:molybdate transport system substrate-binding protein